MSVPGPASIGQEEEFGQTWWGRAWLEALEQRARLDPDRLPRGRQYARSGAVGELTLAPGESVDRWRERRDGEPMKDLGARLGTWVRWHLDGLRDAEPDMPVEDRAADTWEPLFAIADLAGGDWPKRAAAASIANSTSKPV